LKRVPVTMSQTGERETAALCLLRKVERWNPRFRHAPIVLRGSEVTSRTFGTLTARAQLGQAADDPPRVLG
jgi:hypothetical protein